MATVLGKLSPFFTFPIELFFNTNFYFSFGTHYNSVWEIDLAATFPFLPTWPEATWQRISGCACAKMCEHSLWYYIFSVVCGDWQILKMAEARGALLAAYLATGHAQNRLGDARFCYQHGEVYYSIRDRFIDTFVTSMCRFSLQACADFQLVKHISVTFTVHLTGHKYWHPLVISPA